MSLSWKQEVERLLFEGPAPEVVTTAMVRAMTIAGREHPPSAATFARWMRELSETGKLREVIKGVYLNRLGHRNASPAAAAGYVRFGSIVSLSWVLEQAGITNNFGDTITCVIPTRSDWPNPQVGDRQTVAGPFRFFGMPAHVVDAGKFEDSRDLRYEYPRATPERAFADWIYLGASPRSRLSRPPMDLEMSGLNRTRLKRLVSAMGISQAYEAWDARYRAYQEDEDVRENAATRIRWSSPP